MKISSIFTSEHERIGNDLSVLHRQMIFRVSPQLKYIKEAGLKKKIQLRQERVEAAMEEVLFFLKGVDLTELDAQFTYIPLHSGNQYGFAGPELLIGIQHERALLFFYCCELRRLRFLFTKGYSRFMSSEEVYTLIDFYGVVVEIHCQLIVFAERWHDKDKATDFIKSCRKVKKASAGLTHFLQFLRGGVCL